MKSIPLRIVPGLALVCLGILLLLANFGLLGGFPFAWALFFACLGALFLFLFFGSAACWWAAVPGSALLGLAGAISLDAAAGPPAGKWGGAIFLAAIGLGFFLVYLARRGEWWAVIPGGVLFTLAAAAGTGDILPGAGAGAVFFLGLGLTFLLVRFLPDPEDTRKWAVYPAFLLLLAGSALGFASFRLLAYFWPACLILAGVILLLRERGRKRSGP